MYALPQMGIIRSKYGNLFPKQANASRNRKPRFVEKNMKLKTKRLSIRLINKNDWKSLIGIWNDFNHSEYAQYDVPHTETEDEARDKAKRWEEVSPGMEHVFFAVLLENEMIGYVDFHKNRNGYECGYCFHRKYHGKGYAKESIESLIHYMSNGQNIRMIARTALDNTPSVRLLLSLGFQKINEEQVSFYQDYNGNDIYFKGGIFVLDVD